MVVVSLVGSSTLCAEPIEASEGLRIMADRTTGNCVSCHEIPAWKESTQSANRLTLQGNFGPSLQGVGARYNKEQLRQWVVDARDPPRYLDAALRNHRETQPTRSVTEFADAKTN